MFKMVSELEHATASSDTTSDTVTAFEVGLKILSAAAGTAGLLSTAALPIVIPVVLSLIGVQWAYGVYQKT